MENRWILTLVSLFIMTLAATATTTDSETESRADLIRLDEGYLFAERYFADLAETDLMVMEQDALAELTLAVNEVRSQVKKPDLTVMQLHPLVERMNYRSGNRRCVFLFIPVDKAISFTPSAAESVGAVSAGENGPSVNASTGSGGDMETASTQSVPTDSTASGAVAVIPGGVSADPAPVSPGLPAVAASPGAIEVASGIAARNGLMLGELGKLLLKYRADGRIEDFGQVRPGHEIPADAFLVIVDRSLKVVSMLAPHADGVQRDMQTGEIKDPASLHNCGIVWFR